MTHEILLLQRQPRLLPAEIIFPKVVYNFHSILADIRESEICRTWHDQLQP